MFFLNFKDIVTPSKQSLSLQESVWLWGALAINIDLRLN